MGWNAWPAKRSQVLKSAQGSVLKRGNKISSQNKSNETYWNEDPWGPFHWGASELRHSGEGQVWNPRARLDVILKLQTYAKTQFLLCNSKWS